MADDTSPLHEPRETTSVWRVPTAVAGVEEIKAATLRDAGAPAFGAQSLAAPFVDPARCAASGIINIQIVKRDNQLIPLVDGLVPQRMPRRPTDPPPRPADPLRYALMLQRGLHQVEETQTWVFSPCAVSMFVEDGQSLPERCTVSVWQQMTRATSGGQENIGPETMLGDIEIKPFVASDYTASIVYAPYPVVYSRSPRIIIKDMAPVYVFRKGQRRKILSDMLRVALPFLFDVLAAKLQGAAAARVAAVGSEPTVVSPVSEAADAATAGPTINIFSDGTTLGASMAPPPSAAAAPPPAPPVGIGSYAAAYADSAASVFTTGLERAQGGLASLFAIGGFQNLMEMGADAAGTTAGALEDLAAAAGLPVDKLREAMDAAKTTFNYRYDRQQKAQTLAQAEADAAVDDFWKQGIPSAFAVIASFCVLYGVPGADAAAGVLGDDLKNGMALVAFATPFRQSGWRGLYNNVMPKVKEVLNDRNLILKAAFAGIDKFLNTPQEPVPVKKHYSVAELANVLEQMTALMSLDRSNNDLRTATEQQRFADEIVVFRWLTETESANGLATMLESMGVPQRTGNAINAADMSEFAAPVAAAIRTRLRVEIEDPTSCGDDDSTVFEFGTGRTDAALMGLAASGMLQDLERLQRAIRAFEQRLRQEKNRLTWSERLTCWWDTWIYGPLFSMVLSRWKYIRTGQTQRDNEVLLMLGIHRSRMLTFVHDNLHQKLYSRFVNVGSAGQRLLTNLRQLNMNPPQTLQPKYMRELPQKIQHPLFLFPTSQAIDTAYVDVQVQGGVLREYSAMNDAIKTSMRASRAAIDATRRLSHRWETEGPRCIFVHAFAPTGVVPAELTAVPALRPPSESYSLVLQLPGDVRSAEATVRLEERLHRRIVAICHKGPAAQANRSLLSKAYMPDTEPALVAAGLFSELWADELLRLHQLDDVSGLTVSVVETAQRRASRRAAACALFLLAVTAQAGTGIVPLTDDDPALLATQAGRDAARLARRLHLKVHPRASTGVLNRATVRRVREIGSTLLEVGNRLVAKPGMGIVPSEPLQSLFMEREHGLRAFQRAAALGAPPRAESAIASAYPSTLLVTPAAAVGPTAAAVAPMIAIENEPRRPADPANAAERAAIVDAVKKRVSALRVDWNHTDAAQSQWPSVDGLSDAMRQLGIGSDSAVFYVPYGHGHAPPRLSFPPVPAPMFGSVPVWLDDVREALRQVSAALGATGAGGRPLPPGTPWIGQISPVFPCDATGVVTPAHPALLEVHAVPNATTSPQEMRFWAAEPELEPPPPPPLTGWAAMVAPTYATPRDAAADHLQDDDTRRLSSRICCMAWNAERTMQAMLTLVGIGAGAAGGGGAADSRGAVVLAIGDGDSRVASPDRVESAQRRRQRLQDQLGREEADVRVYADRHFSELRHAMNQIDAAAINWNAFRQRRAQLRAAYDASGGITTGQAVPAAGPSDVAQQLVAGDENAADAARDEADTGVLIATVVAGAAAAGAAGGASLRLYEHLMAKMAAEEIWASRATTGVTTDEAGASAATAALSFAQLFGNMSSSRRLPFVDMTPAQSDKNTDIGRKFLVTELMRLRDLETTSVEQLVPAKADAWRDWAKNAKQIHDWAFDVYLDDTIYKWELPIPRSSSEGVSNPRSDPDPNQFGSRKEYYEFVVGTPTTQPEGSDVLHVLHLTTIHGYEYEQARSALVTFNADRATEAATKIEMRRKVFKHTAASAAVGLALARAVLGNAAPRIQAVERRGRTPLTPAERTDLVTLFTALEKAVAAPPGGGGPTALRLSELCAITQAVLP